MFVCARCGAYVGAIMTAQGRTVGSINANCLDQQAALTQAAKPMDFDAETAEQRVARRLAGWGPAELVVPG